MTRALPTTDGLARVLTALQPHLKRGLVPVELQRGARRNAEGALRDVRRAITERTALHADDQRQLVPLSASEAVDVLQQQSVGRLVYVAREDVPDVVPVNYIWDQDTVIIRSGPGPKLQAAQRHAVVAFEVDELDLAAHAGSSVVLVGRAEVVDPLAPRMTRHVDVWAGGPRRHLIRIVPTRISGRRLS